MDRQSGFPPAFFEAGGYFFEWCRQLSLIKTVQLTQIVLNFDDFDPLKAMSVTDRLPCACPLTRVSPLRSEASMRDDGPTEQVLEVA